MQSSSDVYNDREKKGREREGKYEFAVCTLRLSKTREFLRLVCPDSLGIKQRRQPPC